MANSSAFPLGELDHLMEQSKSLRSENIRDEIVSRIYQNSHQLCEESVRYTRQHRIPLPRQTGSDFDFPDLGISDHAGHLGLDYLYDHLGSESSLPSPGPSVRRGGTGSFPSPSGFGLPRLAS